MGTNFSEILIKIQIFLLKKSFENVVCKLVAIFSRSQYDQGPFSVSFPE